MSSNKVSLNNAEKRTKMMEIFRSAKELTVYQLKELERMGKEKGIVQSQIKEVLQSLIDDGSIDSDKIGSTIFYWSFPMKNIEEKRKMGDELKTKNTNLKDRLDALKDALQKMEESKPAQNIDEKIKRDELTKEIESLRVAEKDLIKFISSNENSNSEEMETMKTNVKEISNAVNRWTENIFVIKDWLKRKFRFEEQKINKEFGISEDFDYFSV